VLGHGSTRGSPELPAAGRQVAADAADLRRIRPLSLTRESLSLQRIPDVRSWSMPTRRVLRLMAVCVSMACAVAVSAQQQRATLTIAVPNGDAELTVDGKVVEGTGNERTFETPPLEAGRTYRYAISVKWQPNTYTTMTRTKTIEIKGGQTLAVDLATHDPNDRVRVQYVPTPEDVANEMVKLAGVTSSDVVFEPGCGDARVTIAAVKAGARRAVCIDIDPDLVAQARTRVKEAGLSDRIEVRLGDALDIKDLSDATVVFLYMGDHFNLLIRPSLWKQLPVGARVVSHRFEMGDWAPERTVTINSEGLDFDLHRWTVTADVKQRPVAKSSPETHTVEVGR
jgi:uncharacterized protein (TIGR03000 family)